jgi:hypothetical protein
MLVGLADPVADRAGHGEWAGIARVVIAMECAPILAQHPFASPSILGASVELLAAAMK